MIGRNGSHNAHQDDTTLLMCHARSSSNKLRHVLAPNITTRFCGTPMQRHT